MNIHSCVHPWVTCRHSREPRSAKKFPIATLIASMSLLVGVAGCGEEQSGHAESGQPKSGSASGTSSPRASSDSASDGAEPDPRALGIDTVKWPEDRKGGKSVFDEMPDQLAGMRGEAPNFAGGPYGGAATALGTMASLPS